MPVGYGTTVKTAAFGAHFINTSQSLGEIGYKEIANISAAERLTVSDTDQTIYSLPLATWSGEVPAGTDQFTLSRVDGVGNAWVQFFSDGWSGTSGNLTGNISAWIQYGPSHGNYTNKLYPSDVRLYFQYEGSTNFTRVGTYTPAKGEVHINQDVETPVTKVMISFGFDPDTVFTNNFPSPTVCWGLTYIDEMRWSKTGLTSGQQTVDEIQESNGLLSGLLSAVNQIFQAIINLPQTLGNMIKGLFLPDEENINILRGKWQVFLTTKMGFIYQMFQWVDTFFDGIIDGLAGEDDGVFTIPAFPAFEAGGETVQLWSEPLTVDFSDNAFVQTLQPIACPFILGVTAYHLWFSMSDLMECFFAGKSYRDFSHRRDDG